MLLDVRNLNVKFDDTTILDDVSFTIGAGETVALLGPNGAGKSTLIKAIAGVVALNEGEIRTGKANGSGSSGPVKRKIAYLPQEGFGQSGLTVLEAVLLGRHDQLGLRVRNDDLSEAHHALSQFNVSGLAERRLDSLSGGQRQLAGLAQALYRKPEIMLLDEPTSALDLYRQMLVLDSLAILAREENMTVVCVLHDLSLAARFADRVLFIKEGRLIADDDCKAAMNSEMVGRIYNIEAEILCGREGHLHVAPIRPLDDPDYGEF